MASFTEVVERFAGLWWVRLPSRGRQLSALLGTALTDGLYLLQWPPLAASLPPVALAGGLLFGAFHFGARETFTQSLMFMALVTGAAVGSAQLGLLAWAGYAVADLLLYRHPDASRYAFPESAVRILVPLLSSYALLFLLAVWIPVVCLAARRALPLHDQPRAARMIKDVLLNASLAAGLVYLWTLAAPVLIRPLFTWRGQSPPVAAISSLQETGWVLVAVAAVVGGTRGFLEYLASGSLVVESSRRLVVSFAAAAPRRLSSRRVPAVVRATLLALTLTVFVAGIIPALVDGAFFFLFLTLLLWLREVGSTRLGQALTLVPWWLRLGAAVAVSHLASSLILKGFWGSSFRPALLAVCIWIIVLVLLFPRRRAERTPPALGRAAS
jgi:hypothetical protein